MFTIGMWNAVSLASMDAADVADWKDLGFTLAMSPKYSGDATDRESVEGRRLLRVLDAAAAEGISIVLRDSRATWGAFARGEDAYRRGMEDALRAFGDHPAVDGFYVGDEPDRPAIPDAGRACRLQRDLAPNLRPYLNLLPWYERAESLFGIELSDLPGFDPGHPALLGVDERVGYPSCREYLDGLVAAADPPYLSYDCYSQMLPQRTGWNMYFNNLREYSAAASRHQRGFWSTVLCIGHFAYRVPSEDDLRWQLSTSVAHGASGVTWYYVYQERTRGNYRLPPIDEHGSRTRTFEALSCVNKTFLSGFAPTLEGSSLATAYHTGQCFGGFEPPDHDPIILGCRSLSGTPMIVSRFVANDGSAIVVVVNNSNETSVLGQLLLDAEAVRAAVGVESIGWANEARPARETAYAYAETPRGVAILEWFAPGQMYVYRLASRNDIRVPHDEIRRAAYPAEPVKDINATLRR